jgi:hypothetical protein
LSPWPEVYLWAFLHGNRFAQLLYHSEGWTLRLINRHDGFWIWRLFSQGTMGVDPVMIPPSFLYMQAKQLVSGSIFLKGEDDIYPGGVQSPLPIYAGKRRENLRGS